MQGYLRKLTIIDMNEEINATGCLNIILMSRSIRKAGKVAHIGRRGMNTEFRWESQKESVG
jgi:hypothetical protein